MGKLFIILGIDGAGKTTALKTISEIFERKKVSHIVLERKQILDENILENPSLFAKKFMEKFGELLWNSTAEDKVNDISDEGWLYMHALWYNIFQQHILIPLLGKYDYVILDSWYYKIKARFNTNNFDKDIINTVFKNLVMGDFGIMLDTDPEVCYSRKDKFNHGEVGAHNNQLDYLKTIKEKFIVHQGNVRNQLLNICKENNWKIIDTSNGINEEGYLSIIDNILQCAN